MLKRYYPKQFTPLAQYNIADDNKRRIRARQQRDKNKQNKQKKKINIKDRADEIAPTKSIK